MTLPPGSPDQAGASSPPPNAASPGTPAGQAAPAGQPGQAVPAGQVPAGQSGPAAPAAPAPGRLPAQHVVRRTRVGGVWVASALFALVLLLLLIFILENGQRATISFFGAHGHLPLGVALLLAAVLGVLLVVIPGTGRIIQLRRVARRHRRRESGSAAGTQVVPAADPAPRETGQP